MRLAIVLTIAGLLSSCAPKPQAKRFSPVQYSQVMKQARNYRFK